MDMDIEGPSDLICLWNCWAVKLTNGKLSKSRKRNVDMGNTGYS